MPKIIPVEHIEDTRNKVTQLTDSATDEQYPSAKAVIEAIPFATPQMYGAVGDGLTDDTEAINECLHSNKYVFIPKGFYKISKPLIAYARDGLTVKCDSHAIFIADTEFEPRTLTYNNKTTNINSMLILSGWVGFSNFPGSWEGGIFCCNGIEGLTGVKCTKFSTFISLKDITIVDIGHDGIGIDLSDEIDYADGNKGVNIISGKQHLDNIKCFGQTFLIGGVLPREANETKLYSIRGNTQVHGAAYDDYITRDNIGLKVNNCYDFEINTFYVMSCRIGIEANNSSQVGVHYYHYWLGTDDKHIIKYTDYIKSRAFKGNAYWHFDMFYPDKPYIAFEGSHISCDNTHYICPYKDSIVDDNNEVVDNARCYLGLAITEHCDIRFGDFNINGTSNDRVVCGGIITPTYNYVDGKADEPINQCSTLPYYRNGINIESKYIWTRNYLHPSWSLNGSRQNVTLNYTEQSGWRILGYLCSNIIGSITFKLSSPTGLLNAKVTIKNKADNGFCIDEIEDLYHKTKYPISNYIGLGDVFEENGYKWAPLLFKSDYHNTTVTEGKHYVSLQIELNSIIPFVVTNTVNSAYTEDIATSKKIYPSKDRVISVHPGRTGTENNKNKTILLIGDSYSCPRTLGTENVSGWAALAKQQFEAMGYNCIANGMGGTGFIRAVNNITFKSLLTGTAPQSIGNASVNQEVPPISDTNSVTDIIVCGGYNDVSTDETNYSREKIEEAIQSFITQAKTTYPNATIYIGMVGTSNRYKTSDGVKQSNDEFKIRTEILSEKVLPAYKYADYRYYYLNDVENILKSNFNYMYLLDTTEFNTGREIYKSDGIHPTQKGCEALADGIVEAFTTGNFF